jgi:hypothetical protein
LAVGSSGRVNGWVFVVGHGGGQNRPEDDPGAKPVVALLAAALV